MSEKESVDNQNNEKKLSYLLASMQPALTAENCFGIFRYRYQEGVLQKPDAKMKIAGIVITASFVALFAIFLKLSTVLSGAVSFYDEIDDLPSVVILIQYVASTITTIFAFNETNIKIVLAFQQLDTALHLNMTDTYYKAARRHTIFLLIILVALHVMFSAGDLYYNDDVETSDIIVLPIYFVQDLSVMIFYKKITMLRKRLEVVNDYLRKYIRAKDEKDNRIFTISKQLQKDDTVFLVNNIQMKIKDLANTYDVIGETCSWINDVCNFQIFMTLVSTFTYVIITIWTSLYYFKSPEGSADSLVNIVIWCVRCIFTVAVMCFACERLLLIRNDTKILVNEVIMDYNLPGQTRLEAKAFMELIEAWPLRIFVYDMFSVDVTLMLKFISVATTYLIVIIQISHFV